MDTMVYLVGAYGIVWAFVAGYVIRLAVRQRRLERAVRELQRGDASRE